MRSQVVIALLLLSGCGQAPSICSGEQHTLHMLRSDCSVVGEFCLACDNGRVISNGSAVESASCQYRLFHDILFREGGPCQN